MSELKRWTIEEVNDTGDVILVDFDGTMTTGGYPEIGDANEDVLEYIRSVRSGGDKAVIWTCRTSTYLCPTPMKQLEAVRSIEKWLKVNLTEVDGILMHDKPICLLYIGDETVNPSYIGHDPSDDSSD